MSELNTLPPVARKVYHPCNQCEVERYQVVLAHTNSKTARLECEVCHTKNTLKVGTPAKNSKKKTASKSSRGGHKVRWEELTQNASQDPAPYNMREAFEVETLIDHPKFGLGVVTALTTNSIQVVFEDQERSLVHNRQ